MLTVSIVLFNTPRIQINTVMKSLIDSLCVHILYIIDNSPNDKWRILEKEYVGCGIEIRYIHNINLGYGASHNIALQEAIEAGGDYHLVLNPDIYFGELQYLCKLLPTPFDLIFRRFMPKIKWITSLNNRYELHNSGYDKIINPPCLSGCFMFMRLSTLKKNNLFFDERYFMYCEDFDLIRRIHRVAKTIYFPCVTIVHNHAKESYNNKKNLMMHIKSAIRYFNKFGWVFDNERKAMNKAILIELQEK